MATKIAYLSLRGWSLEKLESYYDSIAVPNGANLASEEHVDAVLKLAEKSRAYLDVRSVLKADEEGSYDNAMDNAISAQRWLVCKNADEAAKVPCPFQDIHLDMTGMMFE